MTQEQYKELDKLNRKTILNQTDEMAYDRLLGPASIRPISQIFKGTAYEELPLETVCPKLSEKILQRLTEQGITNVIGLLDLNRLTKIPGIKDKKWLDQIMPAKDAILSQLPNGYLERWLNNDPSIEPIPEPTFKSKSKVYVPVEINPDVLEILAGIQLEEVKEQLCNFDTHLYNALKKYGILSLSEIFEIRPETKIVGGGKKFQTNLEAFKKTIQDNVDLWNKYASQYRESLALHVFPSQDLTNGTLCEQLHLAVKELYSYVINNPQVAQKASENELYYLKYRFVDNRTKEEMVELYFQKNGNRNSATTQERDYCRKVLSKLMGGESNSIAPNVCLSDELISKLEKLSEDLLWKPVFILKSVYNMSLDCIDVQIFIEALQLSMYSIGSAQGYQNMIFAPESWSNNMNMITSIVHEKMKRHPIPVTEESFVEECLEEVKKVWNDEEDCETLISSILKASCDIEQITTDDDPLYQMKYCRLFKKERIVRILFEEKRELTLAEIKDIDQKRDPSGKMWRNLTTSEVTRSDYKELVEMTRNGHLRFKDGNTQSFTRKQVLQFVDEYGQKHHSFTLLDIASQINSKGVAIKPKTLCTYLLIICARNCKDKNLFKLKSKITPAEENEWSKPRNYGAKNKVLRTAIEILQSKKDKKLEYDTLVRELAQKLVDCEANLKYRSRTYLNQYATNENEPEADSALFVISQQDNKEYICYNETAVDEGLYDLDKIGFFNKKPRFYMELLTKAVSLLKSQKDHKIQLNTLRNLCRDIIPLNYSLDPFYKIFSKDGLRQYTTEIERFTENGKVWLTLKTEKLASVSYQTDPTQDVVASTADQLPQMVVATRQEPVPAFTVDWDVLLKNMTSELGYYGKCMWSNVGSTLEAGINSLLKLIQKSSNRNLREIMPRDLYELWNYKIDKYDLFNYLQHLATFYEALIREIYKHNTGQALEDKTNGLVEVMRSMKETKAWIDLTFEKGLQGFDKILKDLRFKRNAIAHGVDVELTDFQMHQTVNQYIALYVYTVARFLKA